MFTMSTTTSVLGRPASSQLSARRGVGSIAAIGLLAGAAVASAGLLAGSRALMGSVSRWSVQPALAAPLVPVDGPMAGIEQATRGRALFFSICATCHGQEGRGVAGLGKDLVRSNFCRSLTDPGLEKFIRAGRTAEDPLNTTGVAMPPSGGNPGLTDSQVQDIVAYVRGLQNRARMPELPPATPEHLMEVHMAMAPPEPPAAAGGAAGPSRYDDPEYETSDISAGARLYAMTCVSCHGADGRGLPKLGKDLVTSEFVKTTTDDEALIAFLAKGRSTSDPANTTKVDMPPRGGNPALNDDRLFQIVAYLRWLQKHPGQH